MISPRENLLRACRRQGFEWVPLDFMLCDNQIDSFRKRFGHDDYYTWFDMDFRWITLYEEPGYTDPYSLYPREELPNEIEFDVLGLGHSKGSEAAFHMTHMHHPLQGEISLDDIERYPLPTIERDWNQPLFHEVDQVHQQGLAVMGAMQMTIWESSWYLRSMEDLLMDMMMEDEKATRLFDRITGYAVDRARLFTEAGCDLLSLGDDLGAQSSPLMSVEMWERWLKPRLKQVINAAREINPDVLIYYHSCGYATPFIDGLIECGVDILNPVQPESMDFNEVHDTYGDRISFWGTLGTQKLLPFGTRDEVVEVVTDRINRCGEKGGLVLGPTHLVEPEVPFDNLVAILETARDLFPKS